MMRTPFVLIALCVASLQTACIAVVAGAAAGYGTAQYVRNDDVRDYAAPFSEVWPAALASMSEAGYPVAQDAVTVGTSGQVTVNDATLEVVGTAPTSTRVRVRVGAFASEGHRVVSGRIHDGIARRVTAR